MNQIVKSLKETSAQAGTAKQWKLEELCKMAALEIDEQAATIARQSLMIYAKDRQIAELTRMLFALGKQDGQTIRTLKEHLESIEIITTLSDYEMSYKTFKAIRAHTLLAGKS